MAGHNHLIVLGGPSGVGKTPLEKSLRRLYPDISTNLKRLIAYNSRARRPVGTEGVDYYYRTREEIRQLAETGRIISIEARGDLHGIDLRDLQNTLTAAQVFYEGNTFMARTILDNLQPDNTPARSIFLSPFSGNELTDLTNEQQATLTS